MSVTEGIITPILIFAGFSSRGFEAGLEESVENELCDVVVFGPSVEGVDEAGVERPKLTFLIDTSAVGVP